MQLSTMTPDGVCEPDEIYFATRYNFMCERNTFHFYFTTNVHFSPQYHLAERHRTETAPRRDEFNSFPAHIRGA